MMPTRQNTEVTADWRPAMAPARQATEVDEVGEVGHAAFPADPPGPRRASDSVAIKRPAEDAEDGENGENDAAPEPDAKKRRTGLQIAIPYTASGDPEEHHKQRAHILACVARAAIEMIQASLANEKAEAEDSADANPKTVNITVAGNFFPDTETGKVHVQDKAA